MTICNPSNKNLDAVKFGFKVWGLVWLATLLSVIVPIVHFITVPTGIILGPFAGFFAYKKQKAAVATLSASVHRENAVAYGDGETMPPP